MRSLRHIQSGDDDQQGRTQGGGGVSGYSPPKSKFSENTDFEDTEVSNVLRDVSCSRNQPRKSAGDQYIKILKNKIKNIVCQIKLKKPRRFNLALNLLSQSSIYTYINAVANNVMLQLYLLHNFYNIIFKSRYNYIRISVYPSTGAITRSYVLSPDDGSRTSCRNIVLLSNTLLYN